jgi:hypothetical protein
MTTLQSGSFIVDATGQNGATVQAWLASRFGGGLPVAQDTGLPSGSPDAGPITTSVDYGGPGFWMLEIPTDDDYVISISWDGHVYYIPWTTPGGAGGSLPGWMQFGSGTPVGSVVPFAKGAVYWDIANGASYEAIGATDADWIATGGNGDQTVPGTTTIGPTTSVLGADNGGATLSDIDAVANSGNYFGWVVGAADGDQQIGFQVGAPGVPLVGGIDDTGKLTVPGLFEFADVSFFVHAGNPNTHVLPTAKGDFCVDTTTPALYQATGVANTDWELVAGTGISSWGQTSTAAYTHAGNPNTHVTPDAEGDLCIDTSTPALYIATGTADTDWELVAPPSIDSWGQVSTTKYSHAGDPTGSVTPDAKGDLCLDTSTPALYQATGTGDTDWELVAGGSGIAAWGQVATAQYVHAGDPNTHVAADAEGDVCIDTSTPALWIAGAADNSHWVQIGTGGGSGQIQTGSGSPVGTVAPTAQGYLYQDTTNGALYAAVGATDADWVAVGGATDGTVPGILGTSTATWFLCAPNGEAVMQDTDARGGTGNGIYWLGTSPDGNQTAMIRTGSTGQFSWVWNADGSTTFPGFNLYVNAGDPSGVVSANEAGDLCLDTSSPALWQATASGDTNWVEFAAGSLPSWFQSGSGSPNGSVVPAQVGALYQDTTDGALFEAIGATDADWVNVGGAGDANLPGIQVNGTSLFVPGYGNGHVLITDVDSLAGTANGIYWSADGTDGDQIFSVQVGASGEFTLDFGPDGTLGLPAALQVGTSMGLGAATPPSEAGTVATAQMPSSSGTISGAFGTPIVIGTPWVNPFDFDIEVVLTFAITSSAAGSIVAGVDLSTPSTDPLTPALTLAAVTYLGGYRIKVPAAYTLLVDVSGTITVASVTAWAQPA